jgi:hypothetical protein
MAAAEAPKKPLLAGPCSSKTPAVVPQSSGLAWPQLSLGSPSTCGQRLHLGSCRAVPAPPQVPPSSPRHQQHNSRQPQPVLRLCSGFARLQLSRQPALLAGLLQQGGKGGGGARGIERLVRQPRPDAVEALQIQMDTDTDTDSGTDYRTRLASTCRTGRNNNKHSLLSHGVCVL